MTKKWEAPIILAVDGLPKALGDCLGGSTDSAGLGGEDCGCHNGQNTLGSDVQAAGMCPSIRPVTYSHGCSSGGTPGTCFCGTAATLPDF
jgi:hypothetical protein